MSNKIKFNIKAEENMGKVKIPNLELCDYTENEDFLKKADQYDSTNISGRLRLNDNNFYNYQEFYKKNQIKKSEDDLKSNFAYQHQIQTAESILKLPFGGLLADQVGMGKTIEAGMIIAELAYRDEWRTLVITLSNVELMNNWHDEMYSKFGLSLFILDSENKNIDEIFANIAKYQETGKVVDFNGKDIDPKTNNKYQGLIVPFEYLVDDRFINLVDEYNKKHKRHFHIDLIVVDESHRYTSNDSSSSTNKIKALHHLQMFKKNLDNENKKIGKILLLTATPIKNDLKELLELMQIIDPSYTEEIFREKLGLEKTDKLDLTTVLNKPQGVNKWWGWFSTFGKRHTRIDTNYGEDRRFGVKWKKKNSYSYYFNNDDIYLPRDYFIDNDDDLKIKTVSNKYGDYSQRSKQEFAPLKGVRKSYVVEYGFNKLLKEKSDEMNKIGFNVKKFNYFILLSNVIKNQTTIDELKNEIEKNDYHFNDFIAYDDFYDFNNSLKRSCNTPYNKLDISKKDIELKKEIENNVKQFIDRYCVKYSDFYDSFIRLIKGIIPEQQKNKNDMSLLGKTENIALLLCTDNVLLSLQKMKKLGEIINMGSTKELHLSAQDNEEFVLYGGSQTVAIEQIEDTINKNQFNEDGELEHVTLIEQKKVYKTNSKIAINQSSIGFNLYGTSRIIIKAKGRKKDNVIIIDANGKELIKKEVLTTPETLYIDIDYNGSCELGFKDNFGYIYSIVVESNNKKYALDFNSIDHKAHNKEKIIIFCKDDAERRMLVQNQHLWDFDRRYEDTEKSVAQAAKIDDLSFNQGNPYVVSIAYTTDAEGLNLQTYHTMIHYSIVLSPLHMEQRVGRIDRIGQENEMDIYFLADCQECEGYILRFFEYELELFSNWSGDTTASTYVDSNISGVDKKVEFDEFVQQKWNNFVLESNQNLSKSDRVESYENSIVDTFKSIRERVYQIADYSSEIDKMSKRYDKTDEEEFDLIFN